MRDVPTITVLMASEEATIRSFVWDKDRKAVEELERKCENNFLMSDSSGDPLCRVRNSPAYEMLVAELGNELVGIVRGSIKSVTIGSNEAKVGYVLGLRVSPLFRRRGIGSRLVSKMEEWFLTNLVDYSYMATDVDNEASIKLFTEKLGYVSFRGLKILVNTVGRHPIRIDPSVVIRKLEVAQAERLYRTCMSSSDFFPRDVGSVLANALSLGTWVAHRDDEIWDDDRATTSSWAMLSVWNCCEVYRLRVGRVPWACAIIARVSKIISRILPCPVMLALPDVFAAFGFYFMYGLHGEGPEAASLLRSLCCHVHNLATRSEDCRVVVTEVGDRDAMRTGVPRSRLLPCWEDLWCIKNLREMKEFALADMVKGSASSTIFVDPREI